MKYTIGYEREDGDLDVLAAFNLDNVRCDEPEEDIEGLIRNIIQTIVDNCTYLGDPVIVLEREDTPDVVPCEGKQAKEFGIPGNLH